MYAPAQLGRQNRLPREKEERSFRAEGTGNSYIPEYNTSNRHGLCFVQREGLWQRHNYKFCVMIGVCCGAFNVDSIY